MRTPPFQFLDNKLMRADDAAVDQVFKEYEKAPVVDLDV
jgi:hypothetical protein